MSALRGRSPWVWVAGALLVCWLIWAPITSDTTDLRRYSQVIVSVLAVLGVNLATGYGGMISLGHGVFVAVGAFATAYFVDDMSMPWVLAIVLGTLVAGVSGTIVGLPALRIRGIHLALVTLGLAIVFQPLAKRFPSLSGGVSGRAVEARFDAPSWFGDTRYADAVWRYIWCLVVVVVAIAITWNLVNSRAGRAIRAMRDNDTAAAIYGVDLVRTRVATFMASASLAGLGGAMQIVLVPFTSQETYTVQESLVIYATAVIGGLGTIWGSVVGVALREIVSFVGTQLSEVSGFGPVGHVLALLDTDAFVFGLGLVVLTFLFPRGLVGGRRSGPRNRGRLAGLVARRYRDRTTV